MPEMPRDIAASVRAQQAGIVSCSLAELCPRHFWTELLPVRLEQALDEFALVENGPGPGTLDVDGPGLRYQVLAGEKLLEVAPELAFLYQEAATAMLRTATGMLRLVPHEHPLRSVNVNWLPDHQSLEWHVDGPDLVYSSSTYLGLGVADDRRVRIWTPRGHQTVRDSPGLMNAFPAHWPHAVSGGAPRFSVTMCWVLANEGDDRDDTEGLDEHLFGSGG